MSSLLNKQNSNSKSINTGKGAQIIRDSRLMSGVSRSVAPQFDNEPLYSDNAWNKEIEQQIALFFERKDIVEVANLLCKRDESPLYIKKTKNSPLYVYVSANQSVNTKLQEKISIAQTALFLLVKDAEVPIKEVAQAFKIVTDRNSAYQPPLIMTEEFHKRLGLFENIKKTEAIIQKLIFAGQNLGLRK